MFMCETKLKDDSELINQLDVDSLRRSVNVWSVWSIKSYWSFRGVGRIGF